MIISHLQSPSVDILRCDLHNFLTATAWSLFARFLVMHTKKNYSLSKNLKVFLRFVKGEEVLCTEPVCIDWLIDWFVTVIFKISKRFSTEENIELKDNRFHRFYAKPMNFLDPLYFLHINWVFTLYIYLSWRSSLVCYANDRRTAA